MKLSHDHTNINLSVVCAARQELCFNHQITFKQVEISENTQHVLKVPQEYQSSHMGEQIHTLK